ncbi:hypothetical protein BJY00DRAFT_280166 [Aspergillus carlsbadensis]|nr:hypothetical protein BJY00DRAFT_280166 [Aspergillus carlsbadensis]
MPTTLIALPVLTLISIPLALIASFTIFISTVTLYIQFSIIWFKLCSALLTNLFTIPHSTSWSLLSFTVSEPTTPARRRSSDYGVFHGPLSTQQIRGQSQKQSRPTLPWLRSSTQLESPESQGPLQLHSFDTRYTHRPNLRKGLPYTQSSGFLGLTNGDEDRDFEGLGGWRCPPSLTRSPGYRSGRTTPSTTHSVSDEADETAWLSINSRLELPSQPLTLRHGSSNINTQAEPTASTTTSDSHLPWRKNSWITVSETRDRKRTKSQGQNLSQGHGHGGHRHHRRAATTSMLAGYTSTPRSPSLQPPRRHDPLWDQTSASQGQGISARSQSHTSLCEHWARHAVPLVRGHGNNGYFALQPREDAEGNSGARTTSNTTPNEERKPARVVAAGLGAMSQFIPSLGGR